jgi:hypothetical protein
MQEKESIMANELVAFDPRNYTPLALPAEEFREAITENMGDGGMSVSDLMKVKVPSGGGRAWDVGEDSLKELKGIVVFHTSPNAYWADSFTGASNPPDCSSVDGKTGTGNPGGDCASCAMNQFGSDGGKGKACKNMKRLYILLEGNMLPIRLDLPPTSLKAYRQYTVKLTTGAVPYWACETVLTLRKEKNPEGIEYSIVEFRMGEMLRGESKTSLKSFRDAIIPMLEADSHAALRDEAGAF